uniref:Photosystem I assembly protein Ycf4 n=1 Tax=Pleurastrum terricola TaxID=34116 RepID=YCF4_PLETE|nr:photosystem I assembly protein Ycf4 [Pleurastrum terricola]A6YG74.1 RecName: Full=Photosystem I assembly protein Ycf4 [Pleurastrum terricola]ABO69295.1 hypothetical chloroplast RF4 [Pleurastrum terricola]
MNAEIVVNNSNFSSNTPPFLKKQPEIRRYIIQGSRRFSNYWWAFIVCLGSIGFLLTGISSYFEFQNLLHLQNYFSFANEAQSSLNKVELPIILFFPQGLVMCFYGILGLFLSFYLWFSIFLNIGAGFNEIYIYTGETLKTENQYSKSINSNNLKANNWNSSKIKSNLKKFTKMKDTQTIDYSSENELKNQLTNPNSAVCKFAKGGSEVGCWEQSALTPLPPTPLSHIRIFRWGFPGKNRKINLQYSIDQISAIKLEFLQGFNSKRTICLKLSDQREILLTGSPQGDWETFEQLEKQASELAKFLKVNLEFSS